MENLYELFNNKALLYAKSRPTYSKHVQEYLNTQLKLKASDIGADIGAGTGQLTKILASNFNKIFVVEPNVSMLEECKKQLTLFENVVYKCVQAEKTNFETHSLDFIIVAQAFHLFNNKETRNEFKRILKPNGKIIIVYNMKNHDSDLFLENEKVLLRFCPRYKRDFHATKFTRDTFKDIFKENSYDFVSFINDNTEYLDCNTFIQRTLSASYAITDEDFNYRSFIKELEKIFFRFERNKKVKMELSTIIYSGILK